MREDVKELITSAENNLRAARNLYEHEIYGLACFHSHQAVELLLKAYLLQKTGNYPFTHSLFNLLKLCNEKDSEFEILLQLGVLGLEAYYIRTRYPPLLKIEREEAEEAIKLAEKVREFVLRKLNTD